jgi:predicted nucleic acid-binding protein
MAAAWCFPDERSDRTEALLDELAAGSEAAAPRVFAYEVRNVVVKGLRRGRIEEDDATSFLDLLEQLPIRLLDPPSYGEVFVLARRFDLNFYDASYLELAQRLGVPIATVDNRLAEVASAAGVAQYRPSLGS